MKKYNTHEPVKLLTVALVLAFLLNIHKVLIPNVLGGIIFNEYLDISVYFFDCVFLVWVVFIILYNDIRYLSIYRVFHVEQIFTRIALISGLIIFLQALSIYFSPDWRLSVRSVITSIELTSVFLYLVFQMFHVEQSDSNVPRGTLELILIKSLIGLAIFNAFLIITQVILQRSVGLVFIGESFLRIGIPGVATLSLLGEKIMRGYGLFLHPNIAAAFLGLVLIIIFSNNVPRGTMKKQKLFHVEHWQIGIILIALLLTFSRTGILLTILGVMLIVPRGTLLEKVKQKRQLFHVEQLIWMFVALATLFLGSISFKSLSEREISLFEYANIADLTFFGHGSGSYPIQLFSDFSTHNEWAILPVHNFFLYYYYEFGLLGLFLIVFFLVEIFIPKASRKSMFHVEHEEKVIAALGIFLAGFAFTDHFFFTIPQGQTILMLGVLAVVWQRYSLTK